MHLLTPPKPPLPNFVSPEHCCLTKDQRDVTCEGTILGAPQPPQPPLQLPGRGHPVSVTDPDRALLSPPGTPRSNEYTVGHTVCCMQAELAEQKSSIRHAQTLEFDCRYGCSFNDRWIPCGSSRLSIAYPFKHKNCCSLHDDCAPRSSEPHACTASVATPRRGCRPPSTAMGVAFQTEGSCPAVVLWMVP